MAKLNTRMQVDVRAAKKVQTLMHLLKKYMNDLPDELKQSLLELADCDACEFGLDDFVNAGGIIGKAETDFKTDAIISINKILKRVIYDEDGVELEAYPEKFKLGAKGHVIIQWGY